MKAFTTPKICPADFDMKKTWFVFFRYPDPKTGKFKLFKYKGGLNLIKKKSDRITEARALCYAITQQLESGWNPFSNLIEKGENRKTLLELLDGIMETRQSVLKKRSLSSYRSKLKSFKDWCSSNGYAGLFAQNFSKTLAQEYMDYLLSKRQLSGKSHNNHLCIMNFFFNALVKRDIIEKNPFTIIEEQPEEVGHNFPYSNEEKERIKKYLYENNRRLYYACQFVYYCFIRRNELIQLKVGDINWENKTIVLQSALSKNRKQESVTIPTSFEQILLQMGLDMAPKDYYIFGHKFQTCARQMLKPDSITASYRRSIDKLNIGKEKGFYSWKHTGACDLYNATKDPYLVMQQCRHSNIKITMIYLRSLGMTVNERIREAIFSF